MTKTNLLVLFREPIDACNDNLTKQVNPLCGQDLVIC